MGCVAPGEKKNLSLCYYYMRSSDRN